jgi:hypothetical protein
MADARRPLVFDADGAQYSAGMHHGFPCSICRRHQEIHEAPRGFVRIRLKVEGGTEPIPVAMLCADCIGRALIVVERHGWWNDMAASTLRAVRNTIAKRFAKARALPQGGTP